MLQSEHSKESQLCGIRTTVAMCVAANIYVGLLGYCWHMPVLFMQVSNLSLISPCFKTDVLKLVDKPVCFCGRMIFL